MVGGWSHEEDLLGNGASKIHGGGKDKRTEDTISWREKLGNEEVYAGHGGSLVLLHDPDPCGVVLVLLCRCISYRNLLCL